MSQAKQNFPDYHLNDTGEFIIDNYNHAKPFSSFFPGIAGKNGIPMWVFYVNRGQAVSGMGIQDKNSPIMEFLPANWAYSLVSRQGFRTFIKINSPSAFDFYEPFQSHYRDRNSNKIQRMIISPSRLTIEEINHTLNLNFKVAYFTVPGDMYAGLIRKLQISNLGTEPVRMDVLDGLPLIIPYGLDNFCLKNMRRTIEAFVEVKNLEHNVPLFKGKVETADRPDVAVIEKGNFYLGFEQNSSGVHIIEPIVDPTRIFGNQTDFSYPVRFLDTNTENLHHNQKTDNQLPCAFGKVSVTLPEHEHYTYTSIIGHASSQVQLNEMIPRIAQRSYVDIKAKTDHTMIESITQHNFICSDDAKLDQYVKQNFLDNTMRGGFPYSLKGKNKKVTLYLYSRKHGDMERDYNDFRLSPTYYSQGNGNFRDINQNRRSDLFFNPDIREDNVIYFYNMIQLDGFNPLVLKEIRFEIESAEQVSGTLEQYMKTDDIKKVTPFFNEPFTPGTLLKFIEHNNIQLDTDPDSFLGEIIEQCEKVPCTEYGESYWIDHWTYNLDLLENYEAIYPDNLINLLFHEKVFSYYDNPNRVRPRSSKYLLWDGKPAQLDSVLFDEEKETLINERKQHPNLVRTGNGNGAIYRSSLFTKLLCLIVNKMASLDPEGIGIEMEAGKPGWYDALNGLPGLFGSSICETLEVKRHILFLLDKLTSASLQGEEIPVFDELKEFMDDLEKLLIQNIDPFKYWEMAHTAKETYLEKTRFGVKGSEIQVPLKKINDFLASALKKVDDGINKGFSQHSNIILTYLRYDLTEYVQKDDSAIVRGTDDVDKKIPITPRQFKKVPLPLFLEGPVHYLRCQPGLQKSKKFVQAIKKSDLYDNALKMYKVNESLENEPLEIGRARVFTPGWLENESIWLHMEYKYMLEFLRNGLYEEFYAEFKNIFIPFLKPERYGRSILENSSFLVSSAHSDSSLHGNGFVARLSGATAEFIHILILMTSGQKPFMLNSTGSLQLSFNPILPGWLFTTEPVKKRVFVGKKWQELEFPPYSFSFMFLGQILVTYHNQKLKDTFGQDSVHIVKWKITDIDGNIVSFDTDILNGDIVHEIRERKVTKIDIILD